MGMIATHRVKNSIGDTVGFIVNDRFFNIHIIKSNIAQIDNLRILKSGIIRAKQELQVIQYRQLNEIEYNRIVAENPFDRDVQQYLKNWKQNNYKQVLRLLGPRQVGKTTEVKRFAYKNYEYVIYVNLIDDKYNFLGKLLDKSIKLQGILEQYCIAANLPDFVNNRNTILVIDEIQSNADCYNSIRRLREEYNIDIIVTGSHLAITYVNPIYFAPMGTITDYIMLPLSFMEVCKIFKLDDTFKKIDIQSGNITDGHRKLDIIYRIYRKIGGYPAVIKKYLESKSIDESFDTIASIINIFINEASSYFSNNRQPEIFKAVFKQAINQMCPGNRNNTIKSFDQIINTVEREDKTLASRKEIVEAINWLIYSKVLGTCDQCIDGDLRNLLSSRRIYFMDCGIANYLMQISTGIEESTKEGLLTETFAFNELYKLHIGGYSNRIFRNGNPIFSTYGTYELDFIENTINGMTYGIEVKTKTGEAKSLKIYLQKGFINRGIIAKITSGISGDKIDSIPIWAISRYKY